MSLQHVRAEHPNSNKHTLGFLPKRNGGDYRIPSASEIS